MFNLRSFLPRRLHSERASAENGLGGGGTNIDGGFLAHVTCATAASVDRLSVHRVFRWFADLRNSLGRVGALPRVRALIVGAVFRIRADDEKVPAGVDQPVAGPAGRTSTSPAFSDNTRPLSPPHSILAVPRATPITSWICEW